MDEVTYRKLYYQKHKSYFLNYRKQRYEAKKDIINRKIECEHCGRIVIERMYKKHLNTNIHKKGKEEKPCEIVTIEKPQSNGWVEFQ